MRQDLEVTGRFDCAELLSLLNTMTPVEEQRVTVVMKAVMPEEEPPASSAEFAIRFRPPTSPALRMRQSWMISAISCAATLAIVGTLLFAIKTVLG